ncbi:radical SAM protein [Desulfogranum mediterraneum]|uniref:radical SAM protein n=1 Tax=Desulfogranum mediterraneum TaxID=160661 RepID=UPI00040183B2|nr:radical SAM protein [Desulfogranum mediterraneum]
MRTIAFGYSSRCNIRCSHCVAAGEPPESTKMELATAREIINQLAEAGVRGISFTAGEPFVFFDDLLELLECCSKGGIYSRVVTNSLWARDRDQAEARLARLRRAGLSQLRLSYSRWHQQQVPREQVLHAARACQGAGVDYFVSFVTDFSAEDDPYEAYLRDHDLRFFPEPLIYAGRADGLERTPLFTDYQENRCPMNPYLAPDLTMYACCDAGSHFTTTKVFRLGSLRDSTAAELFARSESSPLFHCIRNQGISTIASFAGYRAREIVTHRKCELCKKLFDDPQTLAALEAASARGTLQSWLR